MLGRKTGGRKRGTPNKSTGYLAAREAAGVNPWEIAFDIIAQRYPCTVCHGEGATTYRTRAGQTATRTCESCWGTKRDRTPMTVIARMVELCCGQDEAKPQRLQITGGSGGPVNTEVRLVLVEANEQ